MDLGQFGVWTSFEGSSLSEAVETAQRVEKLGYGALWMSMSLRRDLLVTAAHLLANTEDLIVATGIQATFDREPTVMAAGQRTLDELSDGRFLLGLGLSHAPVVELLHGLEYGPPLATMRYYLDAMDRGVNLAAMLGDDAPAAPTPDPLPRVIAALGPKMLQLAAERANGAHPYFMPPEHTHQAREIMGPGAWLCPEVMVVLDDDPDRARSAARASGAPNIGLVNYQNAWKRLGFDDSDFDVGGSDRLIDATVAWGDEGNVQQFIQRHLDAGADHVCLQFVGPEFMTTNWDAVEALAPGR